MKPFRFLADAYDLTDARSLGELARKAEELGATTFVLPDHLIQEQLSPVPFEAIASIEVQIARCATAPTLVGSSLGGFYATWLAEKHGLRAALVNPFVPHADFDADLFLGEHEMLYSGDRFTFTEEHIAQIVALDCPRLRLPVRTLAAALHLTKRLHRIRLVSNRLRCFDLRHMANELGGVG